MNWCKILGHRWMPYSYRWGEEVTGLESDYRKMGTTNITQVLCMRCGDMQPLVKAKKGNKFVLLPLSEIEEK